MKIPIGHGLFAVIDDCMEEKVSQHSWHAHWDESMNCFHPHSNVKVARGKYRTISMGRLLVGLKWGDRRQVDHINHDTLDNRMENLRICTGSQNCVNRRKRSGSASKYKGVTFNKRSDRWIARIGSGSRNTRRHLGIFKTEEEAAEAYDREAKKSHGEFYSKENI